MSLSAIRTQVKTILETVTGIGKVYDYLRWSKEPTTQKQLFTSNAGKFHVWQITRETTAEALHEHRVSNLRTHTIVLQGFYAMKDKDATEKTFQDLIETICESFREDFQLSGEALMCDPPQVRIVEHREFAGVLCHFGEIVLVCQEYQTYTPV